MKIGEQFGGAASVQRRPLGRSVHEEGRIAACKGLASACVVCAGRSAHLLRAIGGSSWLSAARRRLQLVLHNTHLHPVAVLMVAVAVGDSSSMATVALYLYHCVCKCGVRGLSGPANLRVCLGPCSGQLMGGRHLALCHFCGGNICGVPVYWCTACGGKLLLAGSLSKSGVGHRCMNVNPVQN
jgi:hypothetical protein